jgi:bla regulator protein blaR1
MYIPATFAEFSVTAPAAFAWLAANSQSLPSAAGSALITAIWQGAVIVCVLEIATRLMPRISATQRFGLWSAGFVLSLALPLISLIHFDSESPITTASSSALGSASPHPLLQLDARWGFAIAILWLAASLIRAAALAAHTFRLRRLWKAAQPVQIGASLSAALNHLRRGRLAVCTTEMLDRPSVIGFLSPRILIPGWLLSRLTPGELDQIVLHEAEHLRRADDWTNLFQKLCLVIFPLNPALAWIEHRLCSEREMACDEGVIRITNAPRAYAACLASLAERRLERRAEALSLGAWHRRSELVDRVHRILLHKRTMNRTAAAALLATLGSMLFVGSVEMSRLPQLVAFVPRHNTQAMTPARQVQLDALLSQENADPKGVLLATYSALPAKAVLPASRSLAPAHTRNHTTPQPRQEFRKPSNPAPAAAQQIAQSEHLGDRVIPSEPQPQQWVVVTTWRETSSASRIPQIISDFENESEPAKVPSARSTANGTSSPSAANATSASQAAQASSGSDQTPTQAHQFTVTQLILRVVPASSNSASTQPPTATVRDGWFVIQL